MALTQLTYENKETLVNQPDIAAKNKVTAGDMNEIKTVVNGACTQVDTNTGAISTINTKVTTMFKIQNETINVGTLAGYGGEKYGQQTAYTLPSGYKCLGMTGFQLTGIGFTDVLISQIDADNNYIYWSARKEGQNDAVDIVLTVKLLLVKEDFI